MALTKKLTIITALLAVAVISGLVSCEKSRSLSADKSDTVKKILELEARMNAFNSGTGMMTNFMSVIGYSQFRNGTLDIAGSDSAVAPGDSVSVDTVNYWAPVTCAKVTDTANADGTHTTVYDYGLGCDDGGSLIKGKITYVWKADNISYYSSVAYDHYYSYGMEMNGNSNYSFTSDGHSGYIMPGAHAVSDSMMSKLPVFNWSGTSNGQDDITMTFDNGDITIYKSRYKNVWDSISYNVVEGDYYYSDKSSSYEYHYVVSKPLVTDYACTSSWVPVSGTESITTTQDGITGEYTLDYGDGTCDNLALLTENGKTSQVDFGEIYRILEPQAGSVRPMLSRGRMK